MCRAGTLRHGADRVCGGRAGEMSASECWQEVEKARKCVVVASDTQRVVPGLHDACMTSSTVAMFAHQCIHFQVTKNMLQNGGRMLRALRRTSEVLPRLSLLADLVGIRLKSVSICRLSPFVSRQNELRDPEICWNLSRTPIPEINSALCLRSSHFIQHHTTFGSVSQTVDGHTKRIDAVQ